MEPVGVFGKIGPFLKCVQAVPFYYQSGEEIKPCDRLLLHGEAGQIEFVADPATDADNWYVKTYGGGVMIVEPKVFGSLFIPAPVSDYDDLEFQSRRETVA